MNHFSKINLIFFQINQQLILIIIAFPYMSSKFITLLVFATNILAAKIFYSSKLQGDFVTLSKDGNTIAVVKKTETQNIYDLTILKKKKDEFEQINVINANIYIPSNNYTNLVKIAYQANFKPQFSDDATQIYFINSNCKCPVRYDLTKLSKEQPYLITIQDYGGYCNDTSMFGCYYYLQANYVAILQTKSFLFTLLLNQQIIKRRYLPKVDYKFNIDDIKFLKMKINQL